MPPGGVYRADWYEEGSNYCGTDGRAYIVVVPENQDGSGRWPWHVDGPASNCDRKDDHIHKCWCRHGEAPNFTVNKVGNTCNAGAGSILVHGNGFHGFLRDGYIVDC